MSTETTSVLKLRALGRPFQLGMLYDARNDELIPGITLWNPTVLEKNIKSVDNTRETGYKISTEDTFEEKSSMLGINAELKLSVLAGLVEVSGSAEYINDRKKTEHVERLTLQYSTKTRFDHLTMTHLGRGNANHPEVFDQKIATHVVTGIFYGAEAYLIFDRTYSSTEDRTKVQGLVKAAVPSLTITSWSR
ncbi:unnamed protein product [Didymodactylos carnosus]|uniref:SNTX MACPF/CDC-like domain-containing protein n=1 Tax=Didymodactylos carnosus TaxID=1234261 RepID=A0A815SWI8_9BILA|nr:unnamed protein product [Didymodactylos carnosus]CAF1499281.1 unnamed protein product [Didymodactylos carnosus]CAF4181533.1 unnamed protein product [Didymodactylos carnosus]CAF4361166.1 unnamed protein product [Didymodactylos carnosus]